ncbi:hypothetical protein GCM10009430_00690 [Aquimarina litoralis]|uniref:MG2 domain-containing protein n=1 Tax=Aquimarina litoralis TaxID=584605 RepID=A0ABN1IF74_9FLAO
MHKSKNTLLLFFCLYVTISLGQVRPDAVKQVLTKKSEYFTLEREIIHLHTNKTTYITNEEIWFKAYVLDHINHKPFPTTKNLYLTLYNELGDKIQHKLYLTEKGLANGAFNIPKDLTTGEYTLMASTAHQDNFKEDERYYKKITIQNLSQPEINETSDELTASYDIQVLPEGGNLLEGIINTCGIKIIDQQGHSVKEVNSKLYQKGNQKPITQVYLNKFGMGKFSFTPLPNEKYYVISTIGNTEIKTDLPIVQKRGITLKTSFHPSKPLLIVDLSTNQTTLPSIRNKEFHIIIHQYQKNTGFSMSFTDTEKTMKLAIPLEKLPYGTNTISVFDENYNPIAERLVFNNIHNKSFSSKIVRTNLKKDSIITTLKLTSKNKNIDNASISVSILPVETISNNDNGSIINSIYLQPFVKGYVENAEYYFKNSTNRKKQDLDVLLLTQGWSKYDWKNIFSDIKLPVVPHENGITLTGAINITNTPESKLLVNSRKNKFTEIIGSENDKPLRHFIFENLIFQDSSKIHFALINNKNKVTNANVKASIKSFNPANSNEKAFLIASTPNQNYFSETNKTSLDLDQDFFKTEQQLEQVFITKKKYRSRGAYWFNRHKAYIPEDMKRTSNLMSYLRTRYFQITRTNPKTGDYSTPIFAREYRGKFKSYPFIVNGISKNPDFASQIRLKDVYKLYIRDEVNLPPLILVLWYPNLYDQTRVESLLVTNGFQSKKAFYTPKYKSYDNLFFQQYGVLGWIPNVQKNQNNEYEFSFKDTAIKEAKVFIEGIDQEGNLISEAKIIQIPSNL